MHIVEFDVERALHGLSIQVTGTPGLEYPTLAVNSSIQELDAVFLLDGSGARVRHIGNPKPGRRKYYRLMPGYSISFYGNLIPVERLAIAKLWALQPELGYIDFEVDEVVHGVATSFPKYGLGAEPGHIYVAYGDWIRRYKCANNRYVIMNDVAYLALPEASTGKYAGNAGIRMVVHAAIEAAQKEVRK